LIGLVLPSERGRSARPPALRQVELRLCAVPTLGWTRRLGCLAPDARRSRPDQMTGSIWSTAPRFAAMSRRWAEKRGLLHRLRIDHAA